MEIFSQLAHDLDAEGRYLLINALANQLRYPNSHTHYFSWTLLLMFHEANRVSTGRLPTHLCKPPHSHQSRAALVNFATPAVLRLKAQCA